MNRQLVHDVIHEINRKLLLVEGERKAVERKKIIDSIIVDENGELEQLKELLKLEE
jgi:hypothetical protein